MRVMRRPHRTSNVSGNRRNVLALLTSRGSSPGCYLAARAAIGFIRKPHRLELDGPNTMQRIELRIEKRDLRDIALSALGGFLLVLIPLATRDLGTAIIVGLAFGVPGGAGGGTVACILRRYRERK